MMKFNHTYPAFSAEKFFFPIRFLKSLKQGIQKMMDLGTENSEEDRREKIARNKTCKQPFLRIGLRVFNNSVQEFLHVRFLQIMDRAKTLHRGCLLPCPKSFYSDRWKMRKLCN